MEFIIGNGHMFEEKDVLLAIQEMDPISRIQIAEHVVKCFKAEVEKGENELAEKKDIEKGKEARKALGILTSTFKPMW